jgi:hypothetical protein
MPLISTNSQMCLGTYMPMIHYIYLQPMIHLCWFMVPIKERLITQKAGRAHNMLRGPPSAPLISMHLFSLTCIIFNTCPT